MDDTEHQGLACRLCSPPKRLHGQAILARHILGKHPPCTPIPSPTTVHRDQTITEALTGLLARIQQLEHLFFGTPSPSRSVWPPHLYVYGRLLFHHSPPFWPKRPSCVSVDANAHSVALWRAGIVRAYVRPQVRAVEDAWKAFEQHRLNVPSTLTPVYGCIHAPTDKESKGQAWTAIMQEALDASIHDKTGGALWHEIGGADAPLSLSSEESELDAIKDMAPIPWQYPLFAPPTITVYAQDDLWLTCMSLFTACMILLYSSAIFAMALHEKQRDQTP